MAANHKFGDVSFPRSIGTEGRDCTITRLDILVGPYLNDPVEWTNLGVKRSRESGDRGPAWVRCLQARLNFRNCMGKDVEGRHFVNHRRTLRPLSLLRHRRHA